MEDTAGGSFLTGAAELRRYVNGAFFAPDEAEYEPQTFLNTLQDRREMLFNPLQVPARSDKDRTEVKTKYAQYKIFVEEIVKLSELIGLNELKCVELYALAERKRKGLGMTAYEACQYLFFQSQKDALLCLLTLLQARTSSNLAAPLRVAVCQFTNDLLADSLSSNIVEELRRMADMTASTDIYAFIQEQRWLLAQCLFHIRCQVITPAKDLLELIRLLRLYSREYAACKDAAKQTDLSQVSYLLWLAATHILCTAQPRTSDERRQAAFVDPVTGEAASNEALAHNRELKTQMQLLVVQETWESAAVHQAMTKFSWALFQHGHVDEEEEEALMDNSLINNAVQAITALLTHPVFVNDTENLETLSCIIDHACVLFIIHVLPTLCIRKTQSDELPWLFHTIERLLELLAQLYVHNPSLSLKFWRDTKEYQYQHRLKDFVRAPFGTFPSLHSCFVSYLRLLASMAGASDCANAIYDTLQKPTVSRVITWDHFFNAFQAFAVDLHQAAESGAGLQLQLSPDECQSSEAILALVQKVVIHGHGTREAIDENQQWQALPALFSLLSCSVPTTLKAELIKTITAFCSSPTISSKVWVLLETYQVLDTSSYHAMKAAEVGAMAVNGHGMRDPRRSAAGTADEKTKTKYDIRYELEQIESNQEYPELLAFLGLLAALLESGADTAGVDPTPYVEFVRKDVFCKFRDRLYTKPGDRWRVALGSLRVISSVLSARLDPAPSSGKEQAASQGQQQHQQQRQQQQQQQHQLQQQRLQEAKKEASPSFLLTIEFLDSATPMAGQLLWILKRGAEALQQSRVEKEYGVDFESAVLYALQVLECILTKEESASFREELAMHNPRSQLIPLSRRLFEQGVIDMARLLHYEYSLDMPLKVLRVIVLLSQTQMDERLVLLLEREEEKVLFRVRICQLLRADGSEDEKLTEIKEAIVFMLLANLKSPAQNLTHFLLGFDPMSVPYDETDLHRVPSSCLSVIVDALESPAFLSRFPLVAEMCFKLVHEVCADRLTSKASLNLLGNFLFSQLEKACQKTLTPPSFAMDTSDDEEVSHCTLLQRSWLLRTVALQLHVVANDGKGAVEHPYARRILSFLFGLRSDEAAFDEELLGTGGAGHLEEEAVEAEFSAGLGLGQGRMQVVELVDQPIAAALPELPMMEQVLGVDPSQYRREDKRGFCLIDIEYVTGLLRSRLQSAHAEGTLSAWQWDTLQKKAKSLVQAAVALNAFYEALGSRMQLFESWKQLVEVTLFEWFHLLRSRVLYDLLELLLARLGNAPPSSLRRDPLAESITRLVLVITTKLRERRADEQAKNGGLEKKNPPVAKLHGVLQGLLKGLLVHGTSQTVRGNLYGSLLNYLQLTHMQLEESGLFAVHPSGITAADALRNQWWTANEYEAQQRLLSGNIEILQHGEDGGKMIEQICKDASNGTEVWRAVAFATLDSLVSVYDQEQRWLAFLCKRNFLRDFIEELSDARALLATVSPKQVYVFESKLSLLLHLSLGEKGAKALIDNNILEKLDLLLKAIQRAPDDPALFGGMSGTYGAGAASYFGMESERGAAGRPARHHQVLEPVLRLILSLLTTLKQAIRLQVSEGVFSDLASLVTQNTELFYGILREGESSLQAMREVELVTAICYHLTREADTVKDERIKLMLLHLLPRYCSEEEPWQRMLATAYRGKLDQPTLAEARRLVQGICQNLVSYCRVALRSSASLVLFDVHGVADRSRASLKHPSLEVLVAYLDTCCRRYLALLEEEHNSATTATPAAATELKTQANKIRYTIENLLFVVWQALQTSLEQLPSNSGDALRSKYDALLRESLAVAENMEAKKPNFSERTATRIKELLSLHR